MGCFSWLLVVAGGVFLVMTLLRWFEQTAEAVDRGWWNKLLVLVLMPFAVWLFPSRVAAGRPTAVPHHEPVRGFGSISLKAPGETAPVPDQPPPGTPKEFLVKPIPTPAKPKAPVDPDKMAKLRQKMREQGMLGDGDA